MVIITNNDTLREFVPNVLKEVAGESSLFDKVTPALASAEMWVSSELTGSDVLAQIAETGATSDLYTPIARLIVCKAMAEMLPSLDLILTPNGFGVVSNSNVAPASKERVERLVSSLSACWERMAADVVNLLRKNETWHKSTQFVQWSRLLLSPAELATYVPTDNPISAFNGKRSAMADVELAISREFIGTEFMDELRHEWWTNTVTTENLRVVNDVTNAIVATLRCGSPRFQNLVPTVDLIRNSPVLFPTWHNSEIAQVYVHTPFQNDKKSHGYFL